MRIPTNLRAKGVSKFQCVRIIRTLQKAIQEECFACVGAASTQRVRGCPGNRLSDGRTCPLYEYRPGGG